MGKSCCARMIFVCKDFSGLLKKIPQRRAVPLARLTPGFYNGSDREREQEGVPGGGVTTGWAQLVQRCCVALLRASPDGVLCVRASLRAGVAAIGRFWFLPDSGAS